MLSGQTVVVIDGMPETAEVLQAVFEPLGHSVERVRGFAYDTSRASHGSVLVLHDDVAVGSRQSKYGSSPRVVIGSISSTEPPSNEKHLAPLFQYAELIKAVEGLLNEQCETSRKAA